MTHSLDISQLLSSVRPGIAHWAHEQSGNGNRDGGYAWAQLLLTSANLAMTTAECPNCQQQRPTLRSLYDSGVINKLLVGKLITLDRFHHGWARTLFLLKYPLSLDMDLPSLHTTILSKLPYEDVQNTISTTTLSHIALLLIRKLALQP